MPDRRPHDRADANHLPATLLPGDAAKPAVLTEPGPMMRIGFDPDRIGKTAQRKHDNAAALVERRIGDGKRQPAAPEEDRKGPLSLLGGSLEVTHASPLSPLARLHGPAAASSASAIRPRAESR